MTTTLVAHFSTASFFSVVVVASITTGGCGGLFGVDFDDARPRAAPQGDGPNGNGDGGACPPGTCDIDAASIDEGDSGASSSDEGATYLSTGANFVCGLRKNRS